MKRALTLAAVLTTLAVLTVLVPSAAASGPEHATSPFEGFWNFLRSVAGSLIIASPMPGDPVLGGGGDVGPIEGASTPEGDDEGPIDLTDPEK